MPHNKKKNKTVKKSAIHKYLETKCEIGIQAFEKDFAKNKQLLDKKLNIENELIRLLAKKTVPDSVLPNNDFFTFINYEWMKNVEKTLTKEEQYLVQVDSFRLVQNKVYGELLDIIQQYIRTHQTERGRELSNVYKSSMTLLDDDQVRHHVGMFMEFYQRCVEMDATSKMDAPEESRVWEFLGTINRNEVVSSRLPFVLGLGPDEKNSRINRMSLYPPAVTLLDLDVYFDDFTSEKDRRYRMQYRRTFVHYIDEIFTTVFGKKHGLRGEDVFDVEHDMLMAMICKDRVPTGRGSKDDDEENSYHKVMVSEAKRLYGVDFVKLAHHYGFSDKQMPDFFLTGNLKYLSCGSKLLLENWKTDAWRTYFLYIFCSQIIRFHPTWRSIPFSFLGNFMRGQKAIMVRELVPVFPVAMCFNSLLVNEYIERNANSNTIKYIDTLAKDLLEVFKRKLKRNDWLLPKTKAYALTKLDKLQFIYGSTVDVREDPLLPYSATDVWENLVRISGWRADHAIQLEGKGVIDIPMIDWSNYPFKFTGKQCYIVNAFYTPVENSIYIPLAYMQKPFIDLAERGIEYNLAYIGYTLGHEMSHSLDSMGSRYDAQGNLRNWWGKQDRDTYQRIQRDVIAQYEEYARRDGIEFDASSSIGEDIADISGTSILVEYLKDFQERNNDIIPIRVLSYKAFLVYFAVQSRQLVGKKAIQAQLKTNPHPLDKYRVNVPLSRLAIFRELYGVKKGDGMYWHNTSTIW